MAQQDSSFFLCFERYMVPIMLVLSYVNTFLEMKSVLATPCFAFLFFPKQNTTQTS
eukprot:m.135041 g.135041  ORF g.135041 m.135041 type:complete len:56 (-) comp23891_c2_seq3:946-1113(-)